MSRIFKLEQSTENDDIINTVAQINLWLKNSGNIELSRALALWFNRVFKCRRSELEDIPDFENFEEVDSLLSKNLENLWDKAEQKGYQAGIEQGINLGRSEGEHLKAVETATRMLQAGLAVETVAEFCGLSLNEVTNLKQNLEN